MQLGSLGRPDTRQDRGSHVLVDRAGGEGLSLWTQEAWEGGSHLKDKPVFHRKVSTPNPEHLNGLFYFFKLTKCSSPRFHNFRVKV